MRWLGNYALDWLKGPWPELYFIRHGHGWHQVGYEMVDRQMAESPKKGLGVDIPNHVVPLSPFGKWQAQQTRDRFHTNPDCIYVSQIKRAKQTAEIIFPGREFREDPRLNEKEFGPAHMMGNEEYAATFPEHKKRYEMDGKYFTAKGPNGENYTDLYLRLHSILDTLRRDWAGKCVVVVCHSAVMLSFRQLFERFTPEELMRVGKSEWIGNCGILHYQWPTWLWGWRHSKFRLEIEKPPYILWHDSEKIKTEMWKKAQKQLPQLQSEFKQI